jgi:histidinol-phosphate aminotransferase
MTATPSPLINLRDNVNLWGPPPSAAEVLRGFEPEWIAQYPGTEGGLLAPELARFLGVDEAEVSVGCGSDELIDAALGLAEPGSAVVHSDPTFTMVPVYARANRLRSVPVPYGASGEFDLARFSEARSKAGRAGPAVTYLCSPNNPTGGVIPAASIRALIADSSGLVILDCAYAEFCGEPDWVAEAVKSDRLVVLKTFSKAWGFAGLRTGYAVGSRALIGPLRASRGPFSLNAVAERAVTVALRRDQEWMRIHADQAGRNRDRLREELRARGLRPLPSSANFVLLPVTDAERVAAALLERGIAVRGFTRLPGIGDAVRIGVGPWELLERCLSALREVPL